MQKLQRLTPRKTSNPGSRRNRQQATTKAARRARSLRRRQISRHFLSISLSSLDRITFLSCFITKAPFSAFSSIWSCRCGCGFSLFLGRRRTDRLFPEAFAVRSISAGWRRPARAADFPAPFLVFPPAYGSAPCPAHRRKTASPAPQSSVFPACSALENQDSSFWRLSLPKWKKQFFCGRRIGRCPESASRMCPASGLRLGKNRSSA